MIKLEHANISATDAEAMTRFITSAFPDFHVRGEGLDSYERPWRHVGNDEFYIAIQTVPTKLERKPYGNDTGLNHLGWEVDDVTTLEARMRAAGYEPNLKANEPPGSACISMTPTATIGSSSSTPPVMFTSATIILTRTSDDC